MDIVECERESCDGVIVHDEDLDCTVCDKCGAIGACQREGCDGSVTYNEDLKKCICEKCGAVHE